MRRMRRIGRWMFNGLTVLSLVLCLATVVLWVWSYYRADLFQTWGAPRPSGQTSRFEFGGKLSWYDGRNLAISSSVIQFESYTALGMFSMFNQGPQGPQDWTHTLVPPGSNFPFSHQYVPQRGDVQKGWDHLGVSYSSLRRFDNTWSKFAAILFAYPAGALMLLPSAWLVMWRRRRARRLRGTGFCSSCGYNLTGNVSGVCSECGTVVDGGVRKAEGGQ
jgi:hypothetical protein